MTSAIVLRPVSSRKPKGQTNKPVSSGKPEGLLKGKTEVQKTKVVNKESMSHPHNKVKMRLKSFQSSVFFQSQKRSIKNTSKEKMIN